MLCCDNKTTLCVCVVLISHYIPFLWLNDTSMFWSTHNDKINAAWIGPPNWQCVFDPAELITCQIAVCWGDLDLCLEDIMILKWTLRTLIYWCIGNSNTIKVAKVISTSFSVITTRCVSAKMLSYTSARYLPVCQNILSVTIVPLFSSILSLIVPVLVKNRNNIILSVYAYKATYD